MPGQLRFNRYNLIVRLIGARSTLFFYKKKKKLNETKQVKNKKQNNTKIRFLSPCTTWNKKTKRKKETLKLRVEC